MKQEDIWHFKSPILGFENYEKFVLLPGVAETFEYIQSTEDEHLVFITTDPFLFCPEYDFTIDKRWLELLQIQKEEQVVVRSIVTARSISDITINLQAPLIMNIDTLFAAQIVLERSAYGPRYSIMDLRKQEGQHADIIEK